VRHRAGIDDSQLRFFRLGHDFVTGRAELTGHAFDLSLIEATPYGAQVDSHRSMELPRGHAGN
jgi:hypothetical protein